MKKLLAAMVLAVVIGSGCGPDPVAQAGGWMGEGKGQGYGDYCRGGRIHRDFEGAARWCEQANHQERGAATADCIEEAMFE